LCTGYVITGGGALVKGLQELAEYVLEKPAKIGFPKPFGGMTNIMQNPKFSTVLGLMLESNIVVDKNTNKVKNKVTKSANPSEHDLLGRFSDSLKNVFREIF